MQILFSQEPCLPKPNLPYKTPSYSQVSRFQARNGRLRSEMERLFGHNVLMSCIPDSAKTLLARALSTRLLPEMSIDESLDVLQIYSVADQLPDYMPLILRQLFRVPSNNMRTKSVTPDWSVGELSFLYRACDP